MDSCVSQRVMAKNGSKRDFQASANHTHSNEMANNSKEVWTVISIRIMINSIVVINKFNSERYILIQNEIYIQMHDKEMGILLHSCYL